METSFVGTMLVVSGTCPDGHVLKWQSQPMIKGIAAGNLLLSAAILLCGLTFTGIANLADVLNLMMLSERRFYDLQKDQGRIQGGSWRSKDPPFRNHIRKAKMRL